MQSNKYGAEIPIRLNLGGGSVPLEGFTVVDRHFGSEVFPVSFSTEAAIKSGIPKSLFAHWKNEDKHRLHEDVVDDIYASHVLEHFDHNTAPLVVKEWVRVLKSGGHIKIAVPDFDKIVEAYVRGDKLPIAGYLMGGQTDENDYHKTIFNAERLTQIMTDAGLVDIKPWVSEIKDCAALPISLNLEGTKPRTIHSSGFLSANEVRALQELTPVGSTDPMSNDEARDFEKHATIDDLKQAVGLPSRIDLPRTVAVMSMPRLAFTGTMFSALDVCFSRNVKFEKVEGAFWHQCLTRAFEAHLDDGTEWLIAVDYDSIFTREHFDKLARLMLDHPDADAIAPLQFKRDENSPLMGVLNEDGTPLESTTVDLSFFNPPLTRCKWAHFGFTFIKVAALKRMKKPWFFEQAAPDGTWNEGRMDADIGFWKNFADSDNKLYLANHVGIGHSQMTISWPGETFKVVHQYSGDYIKSGVPAGVRA